jgi:S-adenosylmethionine:tRNA ribosyltransferase-isomerase
VIPLSIMRLDDFDYDLPDELIAQTPSAQRAASRLLYLDGPNGRYADARFQDLPGFLAAGDLLVFNDTRVIKARLFGTRDSGGRVEFLLERICDGGHALAHGRASNPIRAGTAVDIGDGETVRVVGRDGDLYRIAFLAPVLEVLERRGRLPLPPYIARTPDADDEQRYQTVYARSPGAVAAPTAGLHFDHAMLERLAAAGIARAFVTLHVGAGTFQPVRVDDVRDHRMHTEWYDVPAATVEAIGSARDVGRRVVAVGTTTLRALESASLNGPLRAGFGETNLFIVPGFQFRTVDRLITNFHLPRSTLLMLVSAFAGHDAVLRAYRHAVLERYRFFSYGDAMLIDRAG